jgi:hypothetical protein
MPNRFRARNVTGFVLACWWATHLAVACTQANPQNTTSGPPPSAVALTLHVATVGVAADGTCVLVHRQARQDGLVALVFLTAADLFRDADGNRADLQQVSILTADQTISVSPDDVILPAASEGIAVLKTAVPWTTLVPQEVTFAAPPPGATFDIIGQNDLTDCLGAPVKAADGVFGIVISCLPGRTATVMLLSMAESFLIDQIPDLVGHQRPRRP